MGSSLLALASLHSYSYIGKMPVLNDVRLVAVCLDIRDRLAKVARN